MSVILIIVISRRIRREVKGIEKKIRKVWPRPYMARVLEC